MTLNEHTMNMFGKNYVINLFENPDGQKFNVVAAKTANLHFHGDIHSHATWFPGMSWQICVCQSCKQHMGWYFRPMGDNVGVDDKKSFIGLVVSKLISAEYLDWVVVPRGEF
ncbi:unnamed protein product, partial [Mesorhabditis spiculigera]